MECLVRYASVCSASVRLARHVPVWSGGFRQAGP